MSSVERTAAPTGERDATTTSASFLRANAVCVVLVIVAGVLAGTVWAAVPHKHEISSLWVFLFELTPFVVAAFAIAWLDVGWARRLRMHLYLVPVTFFVMFCYFVPRIFYFSGREDGGGQLYYHMLTLVPLIILSLCLAHRLGGGTRSGTLRLGIGMLLIQLSGLEDLAYLTVNPHPPGWQMPDVWDWAYHMSVFFGHAPSATQAYVFIAIHVTLALLVFFLPARVVTAVVRRRR